MALDPHLSPAFDFISNVEAAYAGLIQATVRANAEAAGGDPSSGREPTLGGNLLYAGELDGAGRVLVVAGNIAGAASLCASADPAIQKQAVRDGVVDFLVTSLDEALRILKNEIRKRETVAVCVGAEPAAVEREMLERGVAPDLLRPTATSGAFTGSGRPNQKDRPIQVASIEAPGWLTWTVALGPARWLPRLDAIALDCLGTNALAARRWLHRAPRYLGRLAHGLHLLRCDRQCAVAFTAKVREQVACGEIGVPVEIRSSYRGTDEEQHVPPPETPVRAS